MALTQAHKLALRDWLQANVHKAVRTTWYREGIKDENGKPVYGECPVLDENGQPTGETYYGRTFIVRSQDYFDWREVVRRVWRKAIKNGYDVTPEQVRDFLSQYASNIRTWAGTGVGSESPLTDAELDALDPDA